MKDTINYLKTIREVTYSQGGVDCLTKAIEACEKQEAVRVWWESFDLSGQAIDWEED